MQEILTPRSAVEGQDFLSFAQVAKLMGVTLYDYDGYQLEYIDQADQETCYNTMKKLVEKGCTTVVFDLSRPDQFKEIREKLVKSFPDVEIKPIVL